MPYKLTNYGNTCFFNATLQCLFHTPHLYTFLQKKRNPRETIYHTIVDLISTIGKDPATHLESSIVSFFQLFRTCPVQGYHFVQYQQEDMHELLALILESLDATYTCPGQVSFLKRYFTIQLEKKLIHPCTKEIVTQTTEEYQILPLPLSNHHQDLDHCLQDFLKNTITTDYCHETSSGTILRYPQLMTVYTICSLPSILIFMFLRYDHLSPMKRPYRIFTPKEFHFQHFPHKMYRLYAIGRHSGITRESGHYYALCRCSNGNWWNCNDDRIHPVANMEDELNHPDNYLLFYTLF